MPEEAVKKLTVAAAALAFNLPERSLFRAVEKGHVPSTKQDGVTVVDPSEVQAWAERRAARAAATAPPAAAGPPLPASLAAPPAAAMAGSLPAAHGGSAVGGGRASTGVPDGDLAAVLFAAFREGEHPADIVERLRVAPAVAAAAYRQYQELQGLVATKTPLTDRLERLEAQVQAMASDLDAIVSGHAWTAPMLELRQGLEQVNAWLARTSQRG